MIDRGVLTVIIVILTMFLVAMFILLLQNTITLTVFMVLWLVGTTVAMLVIKRQEE